MQAILIYYIHEFSDEKHMVKEEMLIHQMSSLTRRAVQQCALASKRAPKICATKFSDWNLDIALYGNALSAAKVAKCLVDWGSVRDEGSSFCAGATQMATRLRVLDRETSVVPQQSEKCRSKRKMLGWSCFQFFSFLFEIEMKPRKLWAFIFMSVRHYAANIHTSDFRAKKSEEYNAREAATAALPSTSCSSQRLETDLGAASFCSPP